MLINVLPLNHSDRSQETRGLDDRHKATERRATGNPVGKIDILRWTDREYIACY